jgi:hypothetical protein
LEGSLSERGEHAALIKGDVTKSPGFKREKQLDKQRRKEKRVEEEKVARGEGDDHKSSFLQCTFNMANILMVSICDLVGVFTSKHFYISHRALYFLAHW